MGRAERTSNTPNPDVGLGVFCMALVTLLTMGRLWSSMLTMQVMLFACAS